MNVSKFFRKLFICPNDVATYIQYRRSGSWTIAVFPIFIILTALLSLLMFLLILQYEQQVYSLKVLNITSSSVTWFPNIDSAARNFGFTQAFFQEVIFSLLANEDVQSHPVNEWKPISGERCSLSVFWSHAIILLDSPLSLSIIKHLVEWWTVAITISSVLPEGDV